MGTGRVSASSHPTYGSPVAMTTAHLPASVFPLLCERCAYTATSRRRWHSGRSRSGGNQHPTELGARGGLQEGQRGFLEATSEQRWAQRRWGVGGLAEVALQAGDPARPKAWRLKKKKCGGCTGNSVAGDGSGQTGWPGH